MAADWGGKRKGAGRTEGSTKLPYGPDKSESCRVPGEFLREDRKKGVSNLADLGVLLRFLNWNLADLLNYLNQYRRELDLNANGLFLLENVKYNKKPYILSDTPVAAGFDGTFLSETDHESSQEYDIENRLGNSEEIQLVSVKGLSMIDADIHPGDVLAVKFINYPMQIPNTGDIVVAKLGDMVTVKEYREVNNRRYLVPHNQDLEEYELVQGETDFYVYGIVTGLIREFSKDRRHRYR